MAAFNGSPPQPPRVPAWKRIGLKLKYARDEAVQASRAHEAGGDSAHSPPDSRNDDTPSVKRRKTSVEHARSSQGSDALNAVVSSLDRLPQPTAAPPKNSANHKDRVSHEAQIRVTVSSDQTRRPIVDNDPLRANGHTTPKARRKSVTFTPDTKQDDESGRHAPSRHDSRDTLSLLSESSASTAEVNPSVLPSTSSEVDPSASLDPEERQDPEASQKAREYLAYLQLFHKDRSSWKFNKKKQKDLLRNLFRVDRIPSEHNEALLEYISGLQGVRPRQKIINDAEAILKEIVEKYNDPESPYDMESDQARRDAYQNAMRRQLQQIAANGAQPNEYDDIQYQKMKYEAARGERAEAILGQLLQQELYPDAQPNATSVGARPSSQTATPPNDSSLSTSTSTIGTPHSKPSSSRQKRKERTLGQVDDDSDDDTTTNRKQTRDTGLSDNAPILRGANASSDTLNKNPSNKKHKIFDDDFLDEMFPKKPTYRDTAPKRKPSDPRAARGHAYTHGNTADESGSEDD